jgi:hypothetical protein
VAQVLASRLDRLTLTAFGSFRRSHSRTAHSLLSGIDGLRYAIDRLMRQRSDSAAVV